MREHTLEVSPSREYAMPAQVSLLVFAALLSAVYLTGSLVFVAPAPGGFHFAAWIIVGIGSASAFRMCQRQERMFKLRMKALEDRQCEWCEMKVFDVEASAVSKLTMESGKASESLAAGSIPASTASVPRRAHADLPLQTV